MITATAESYEQARELLELGVDRIYIGGKNILAFGLPKPFFIRRNAEKSQSWYMSQVKS